jgi:hypothetical protein
MRAGAIVWFTRKNYTAHRALDPEGLPPTFDEWRAHVGHHTGLKRPYLRVVFCPGQLAAWCRAEGREIDASARAAFAEISATQSRRRGWSGAARRAA